MTETPYESQPLDRVDFDLQPNLDAAAKVLTSEAFKALHTDMRFVFIVPAEITHVCWEDASGTKHEAVTPGPYEHTLDYTNIAREYAGVPMI